MLKFKTSQKIFRIGEVQIGGQPGENPTLLIGSLFYHGQKLLLDEKRGEIDKEETEAVINLQEEFSDKTKNPCMIDLVGTTEESIKKLLSFVSGITTTPILIDSPNINVRIAGVEYAHEIGLENRIVYNSLIPDAKPQEFEALSENGVKSAVLLTYQKGFMTSLGRVETIKDLLKKTEKKGISKPIIDTFVMDVPSLSMASRAIISIKNDTGLPCGCGAHNAMSTWAGFKKRMGSQAVIPCTVAMNTVPVVLGADFVLYGPIEDCKFVFPAVSAINSSYKYLLKNCEQLEL